MCKSIRQANYGFDSDNKAQEDSVDLRETRCFSVCAKTADLPMQLIFIFLEGTLSGSTSGPQGNPSGKRTRVTL